jgi:hypothetical protein
LYLNVGDLSAKSFSSASLSPGPRQKSIRSGRIISRLMDSLMAVVLDVVLALENKPYSYAQ